MGGYGSARLAAAAAVLVGVAVCVPSAVASAAPADPGVAGGGDAAVIVVLRDQHPDLSARGDSAPRRAEVARAEQAPLVSRLADAHARDVHALTVVNAVSATVSRAEAARLAADPAVAAVLPDLPVRLAAPTPPAASGVGSGAAAVGGHGCATGAPSLEPEALQLTHTAYADQNRSQARSVATGKGVRVAFIADGIDVATPDLVRADGSPVIADYRDFSGEGTDGATSADEAFGDASAIAAQGRLTYDVGTDWAAPGTVGRPCPIQVRGMAPDATLYALKVFGGSGFAPSSRFLAAVDYAVTVDYVDVINESFYGDPYPDNGTDPMQLADDAAVRAGVTVIACSGDGGPNGTIGSPASDPNIISVGATTQFRSYAQLGYGGIHLGNGTWASDNISALSAAGVTQNGRTVDLVAPGDLGWALCGPDTTRYTGCVGGDKKGARLQNFGGTSQSAPFVAGAAALVIQAYQAHHGGARPSPSVVKQVLTSTAQDLGHPASEQGAGLLDSDRAVRLAASVAGGTGGGLLGGGLLLPGQLDVTGAVGHATEASVTVTNASPLPRVVTGSVRGFGPARQVAALSMPLDTTDPAAPRYADGYGFTRVYAERTFTVPAGADRLDAEIATPDGYFAGYRGSQPRFGLIDPNGVYQAYSLPQGLGDYGHVDVRSPAAGTWRVVVLQTAGTYKGTVQFAAQVSHTVDAGHLTTGVVVLAPGETRAIGVRLAAPTVPGDRPLSVQLTDLFGHVASVAVIQRAPVPLDGHGGTFTDTLTGGNGRWGNGTPAQVRTYALDLPAGLRDVGVSLTFPDRTTVLSAYLLDPQGQVAGNASSDVVDAAGHESFAGAVQLWHAAPRQGRWLLTVELANPVSGKEISQPLTARVAFNSVQVSAPALPAGTRLAAGVPVAVPVRVTNTGVAPEAVFADARLTQTGDVTLLGTDTTGIPVPQPATAQPRWLVPTHTDAVSFAAAGTAPVTIDAYYATGQPELYAAPVGTVATARTGAAEVSAGPWWATAELPGPFTGTAPPATVTFTGTAHTRLFDPAFTSSTGDVWRSAVAADHPATPVLLAPGASTTITVTITPQGKSGEQVRGTLFVDDFNYGSTLGGAVMNTMTGGELAGLPYEYTIA
ncbi:S8 family serine peptidase [Solihabitans fulvus]|uniref:S8 family serine peptidase n=1 Tax=Solihabitans fulvus TaxID=1892852 RepID=A0A5B2XS27_9PSEU|nr:S8 family serine peptidase [Solihabitans fulvus]KAA2265742.1 S8 family serine peptidase [Solihabitans fulvus]